MQLRKKPTEKYPKNEIFLSQLIQSKRFYFNRASDRDRHHRNSRQHSDSSCRKSPRKRSPIRLFEQSSTDRPRDSCLRIRIRCFTRTDPTSSLQPAQSPPSRCRNPKGETVSRLADDECLHEPAPRRSYRRISRRRTRPVYLSGKLRQHYRNRGSIRLYPQSKSIHRPTTLFRRCLFRKSTSPDRPDPIRKQYCP